MVPKQLTLRNFLSYRAATLDFAGLQVACVAGPNGSGKSSLLEAIAWAIWGHSRTVAEDDVIHLGTLEAQVDFTFEHQQQLYRVVRSRRRRQGGALEFQVETEQGFRPLTQRGIRSTQKLICQTLRLDYETFVNSAYLRQGRADEFMLKRPSERKQILADLLKLGQYDNLAEQAKERAREAKAKVTWLEAAVANSEAQVQQRCAIAQAAKDLEIRLAKIQQAYEQDQTTQQQLEQQHQQRQTLGQSQALLQQQLDYLHTDAQRLEADIEKLTEQLRELATVLAQADEITAGLATLQALEVQDETFSAKFQQQQTLQAERDRRYQAHQTQAQAVQTQQQQRQHDLDSVNQQLSDLQPILQKRATVNEALVALAQARDRLQHLDQIQLQVSPGESAAATAADPATSARPNPSRTHCPVDRFNQFGISAPAATSPTAPITTGGPRSRPHSRNPHG